MRVLVTGGAGFIGSHLVDRLLQENHEIVILDNLSSGTLENIKDHVEQERIVFVNGDVRDHHIASKCLKDVDSLVHLAAITSVPFSIKNPVETFSVNVDGTENLLRASVENNIRKVIFASSCAVYGEPESLPISEDHPWRPLSPYASSKAKAALLCDEFNERTGLETVRFQIFNVYGPRQNENGYGGVISRFVDKVLKDEAPIIFGDGEQTRDFIYVEDVVNALALSIASVANVNSFNLGSGKSTTIKQLLQTVARVAGRNLREPVYESARPGDIRHSQADTGRIEAELKFRAQTTLESGLRKIILEK